MILFPTNGYLIVQTERINWRASATQPSATDTPFNPVWLLDSLGIRAAIFLRCPRCKTPLGINPATRADQDDWQKQPPELNALIPCPHCSSLMLMTNTQGYFLAALPAQHVPSGVMPLTNTLNKL